MYLYDRDELDGIFAEAFAAGRAAADAKLAELVAAGPRYSVHQAGFGEPNTAKNLVGYMLDNCGGAYLTLSGKSATHRELRRYLGTSGRTRNIPGGGRVYYRDAYPTGFALSLFDMHGRQEMAVDIAAMEAVKRVLDEHGLDGTRVHSYID
jgi:hypothetical protein